MERYSIFNKNQLHWFFFLITSASSKKCCDDPRRTIEQAAPLKIFLRWFNQRKSWQQTSFASSESCQLRLSNHDFFHQLCMTKLDQFGMIKARHNLLKENDKKSFHSCFLLPLLRERAQDAQRLQNRHARLQQPCGQRNTEIKQKRRSEQRQTSFFFVSPAPEDCK